MARLHSKRTQDFYLTYKFIKSFGPLLKLLYPRLNYAVLLTICLIVTSGSYEVVNYHSGTIIGSFYSALISKNESMFWNLFWKATLIYLGQCLLLATMTFFSWILNVVFRKNLVTALHNLYFRNNTYYRLNSIDDIGIDNPDQRITQDADRMCTILSKNIYPYLLISPGVIAFYTWKTWETAGPFGTGIIYVYFIFGVIANRLILSPLTKWTARAEKSEGDFRHVFLSNRIIISYKHVSVRNNAEESAFYHAAEFEKFESDRSFMKLYNKLLTIASWKYPAQFLQNYFNYYGAILSYVIQVFPIFIFHSYEDMDASTLGKQISNNAFYFIYLINSFTRLTDLAISIGEMAGYSQRLSELISYMKSVKDDEISTCSLDNNSEESLDVFITEDLSYTVPTELSMELASGLTIRLPRNRTLLITGSSGVGKTSLLRILGNLWKPSIGKIHRNFTEYNSMFLPQRPYFPTGELSLRQQILFPRNEYEMHPSEIDDNRMLSVLKSLKLDKLIYMCGTLTDPSNFEWQDTLSPGEQQRLSIARVLYHRPSYVFLDEATSSLSTDAEAEIYTLLKDNEILYISVGHRQSLKNFHDWQLNLNNETGWQLITEVVTAL